MQLRIEDPSLARVLGTHPPRPVIPHQTIGSCHTTTDEAIATEIQYPTSTEHPSTLPSMSHNCSVSPYPVTGHQSSLVLYLQGLRSKCRLMIPPLSHPLASYAAVPQDTFTPVPAAHLRDTLQPSITELQTVPESPPLSRPASATPSALPLLSQPLQSRCEDREQLVQESDDEIDMPAVPTTPIHSQNLSSSSQSPAFYEAEHKQIVTTPPHMPHSQTSHSAPHSLEASQVLPSPDPGGTEVQSPPPQKKARLCNDTLSNSHGDDVAEVGAEMPASLHQSLTSHDACGTTDNNTPTAVRGKETEKEEEELSTEEADDGSSTLDQAVPCESAREHALVANLAPCNLHWGRGDRGPDEGRDSDQLSQRPQMKQQTMVREVDQQTVDNEVDQTEECEVQEEQQLVPCGPDDDAAEEDSPSHPLPLTSLYEEQHGRGRHTLDQLSTCEEITDHNSGLPRPWPQRNILYHSLYYTTHQISRPTTATTFCGCSSRGKQNTHSS